YKPIGRPESTRWLLVGASMMLSACSALTTTPASTPAAEVRPAEPASLVKVSPLQNPEVEESMPRERREGRVLLEQVGSGGFVEPAASRGPATTSGGVNVNFENAPIVDVLAAILGDLLRVPYSLEGDVKGDITLMTTQPVPQDALLDLLESVLESKGIVIVKGSNGLYRVGSGAALRREVPLAREAASQRGYSIRIMPLRYLSVVEAQKLMEPLGMSESVLRADPVRNILILGASAPQMQNIDRTLRMLDVDVFKGMSFGVYEIVNLEAQTIVERLNAMMGTPEAAAMSNVTKLIALEEINSVMVITPQPDQLDNIRTWLKRLDELGIDDAKAGEQLYVYHVQNGQAAHLANLLGQVFGAGSASSAAQTSGTVAPGLAQSALSSSGETSTAAPSKASGGVSSATAESGARIVADESNNSLLVRTTAKEWRELRAALARIDRTPAQVLVEVSIWEVTLKDELNYGVEWFFNSQGGATGTAKGGLLSFNESGSVARAAPGLSYQFSGSYWRGVINT
ncbi:MAG: hypothetical protein LPK85_15580, partial [Gammaproteobacteria bacterium]|nr:hypothetical protein [Gammaproteobacteria bacterium]